MKAGKTLVRKGKIVLATAGSPLLLLAEEKKVVLAKLDRCIRWNTLLTYVNINLPNVLEFALGNRIEVNSADYY